MVVNPPVSLGGFHHLKPPCQIEVSNPNPTEIVMNTIFSVSFWGSICLAQHSQTSARNDLCRNWSSRLLSPVAMVGNKWKYGNMAWDEVWVSYIWKDVCHNSQSWLATAFYCMRHWVSRCRLCSPMKIFKIPNATSAKTSIVNYPVSFHIFPFFQNARSNCPKEINVCVWLMWGPPPPNNLRILYNSHFFLPPPQHFSGQST